IAAEGCLMSRDLPSFHILRPIGARNPRPASPPSTRRHVTVLHVEDLQTHCVLVANHLRAMPDFQFTILYAESEAEAIGLFEPGRIGLVILDYYLKQGNGGGFLRRMRSLDPCVPVISVSGGHNAKTASELLLLGIDACINKHELDGEMLAQSVRETVSRADAWSRLWDESAGAIAPAEPAWDQFTQAMLVS
ncbi:MAG TPA: response regulator, partial [Isosphaeraceae bacterium]|nr:response regulator [Isosphaeraceae bacterium]